jgi:membrane-associated phospholipid phosphatase
MVNEYAAMPSMHVAWSAIAGIMLALVIGRRWAWGIAAAHPTMMAFTVVVTANHYVMDVVGGLFVLALSIASVAFLPRLNTVRGRMQTAPAFPRSTSAAYGD